MRNMNKINIILFFSTLFFYLSYTEANAKDNRYEILSVGNSLPEATLKVFDKPDINLADLKGRVKIISIVPQLNTPTCDEQTHRFSETNGGLDKYLDIVTISTNSAKGQYEFAKKSQIKNIRFLSDSPNYEFGTKTGLLNESFNYLKRTVLVVDKNNIIRYADFVRGGGLPDIETALKQAKIILQNSNL